MTIETKKARFTKEELATEFEIGNLEERFNNAKKLVRYRLNSKGTKCWSVYGVYDNRQVKVNGIIKSTAKTGWHNATAKVANDMLAQQCGITLVDFVNIEEFMNNRGQATNKDTAEIEQANAQPVEVLEETDGSEEDADEETITAIIPADDDDADDELIDPPAEVIVEEIKVGDDIVEYHDGKFFGVQSMKYGGLIHLLPNGDLAYKTNPLTLDGKRIDFEDIDRWDSEDFFQIMAERGACVIGEPTPEKTSDDFMAKLSELKNAAKAAQVAEESARITRDATEDAYNKARTNWNKVRHQMYNAEEAIEQFFADKAKEMRDNLLDDVIFLASIVIIAQDGKRFDKPELSEIWINFTQDDKPYIYSGMDKSFGIYDTPEQVTVVIERLKAAIERGDKEFTFPTVEELMNPPKEPDNSTPDKLRDSLARGMKEGLLKVQSYCAENNLTEAKVEMERYQICSQALHESCAGGASDNPSELLDDELKQSREFKYYLKQQRPVKGSAPEGYISAKDGVMKVTVNSPHVKRPINKTYYGEYIYDKPLTDRQIIDYDLAVENEIGIDEEARIQRVIKEKEPRPITA